MHLTSRLRFALAPMQLIDLAAVLAVFPGLRGLRALRLLRLLRTAPAFRYANPFTSLISAAEENGLLFTFAYIVYFKFIDPAANSAGHWWFGISPEGIGVIGMLLNFAIAILISRFTKGPPHNVVEMVERIRYPRGAGKAHELSV